MNAYARSIIQRQLAEAEQLLKQGRAQAAELRLAELNHRLDQAEKADQKRKAHPVSH